MNVRTIIVPTDFSDCSKAALAPALAFARAHDAEIVFVHVAELPFNYAGYGLGAETIAALQVDLHDAIESQLARLRAEAGEVRTRVSTRNGTPSTAIVDAASDENADLIIISTHGYSGFKRWWLGSTSEQVVQSAPCPVLTIPPTEGTQVTSYRKILVTTDFSPNANVALPVAGDLARRSPGSEVVLLHVEQPNDFVVFDMTGSSQSEHDEAIAANLAAARDDLGADVECRTRVDRGVVYQRIVEVAAEEEADLIVISSHGRTGVQRVLLGSTTERILRAAPCPVLTVQVDRIAEPNTPAQTDKPETVPMTVHPNPDVPIDVLTARDVMSTDLVTVSDRTPLTDVETILGDHGIGGVPVTDESGHVVGVLSIRDLVAHYAENPELRPDGERGPFGVPRRSLEVAADIMTSGVYAVDADATVEDVARQMVRWKIHRILVRDGDDYVGMITSFDVLDRITRQERVRAS